MSSPSDPGPYRSPNSELGGVPPPSDPFRQGFLSIFVWGGILQSLVLLTCLLWRPLQSVSDQGSILCLLASAPLFILALLLVLGRTIAIRVRSRNAEYRRGGGIGSLVFFGSWLLTSALGCGYSLTMFKLH